MDFDDLLIAIIIAGIGLSGAYFRAEYVSWRRYKAAIRRKDVSLLMRSKNTPSLNIAMSLCGALVLLTLACMSATAAGQDAPMQQSLTPGMRVRILAPDISPSKIVGTINRVDDQSVTIDVPGRSEPVSVLREKIARLDVSTGRRSRWVDAAIGAGIGAAGSALACSAGEGKHSYVSNTDVTAGCALVGGLLGAGIGAAIPPGEHWNEMPANRYRIGFAPRLDHGLNLLAVAWRF